MIWRQLEKIHQLNLLKNKTGGQQAYDEYTKIKRKKHSVNITELVDITTVTGYAKLEALGDVKYISFCENWISIKDW